MTPIVHRVRARRRHPGRTSLAALLIAAGTGCTDPTRPPHALPCELRGPGGTDVRLGESRPMGMGSARTYLIVAKDGCPVEFGVALTERALQGLPTGSSHATDGPPIVFEFALPVPADNPTPYRQVVVDWNPGGHEPPGIYDVPHFDVHFYAITEAQRREIDPADPRFQEKSDHVPPAAYLPTGYVRANPQAVPHMGVHWIDPTSPEHAGAPFTRTFTYGTWDGDVVFVEPMIAKAHLESRPDETLAVRTPEKVRQSGYHPGAYRIRWNAPTREYVVALSRFRYREGES